MLGCGVQGCKAEGYYRCAAGRLKVCKYGVWGQDVKVHGWSAGFRGEVWRLGTLDILITSFTLNPKP